MSVLQVNAGTLPGNFCPSGYQDLANGLASIFTVNTGSGSSATVTISSTKPSDTTVVWARIDSLGRFLGMYIFGQGAWLLAHPLQPGSTIWWFTILPNFSTFDGGDANALGAQSGPMWQQAVDSNSNLISAQFVLTPGTLPSGSVISLGGTGGEENHILLPTEGPPHQHFNINTDVSQNTINGTQNFLVYQNNAGSAIAYNLSGTTTTPTLGQGTVAGGVTPPPVGGGPGIVTPVGYAAQYQAAGHNNIPPYATGYLLQRTSRIFYAVN